MIPEAVSKLAPLLQSRRISANALLGFFILIAAGFALAAPFELGEVVSGVAVLDSSILLLLPGLTLFLFWISYSLANLLIGLAIDLYRFRAGRIESRRAAQREELQRAGEARQRENDRRRQIAHLRRILPDLPASHRKVLKRFHQAGEGHVTLDGENYTEKSALTKAGFIRQVLEVEHATALYRLHLDAVAVVTEYFEEEHRREAEARRAQAREAVSEADEPAKTLLQLFGLEGPKAPGEPAHPWMEYKVHEAIRPLLRTGVLTREPSQTNDPPHTERIGLTPEALEPVEQLILGHPVSRRMVLLDRSQIASNVDTGGGTGRSLAHGIPFIRQTGTGSSPGRGPPATLLHQVDHC